MKLEIDLTDRDLKVLDEAIRLMPGRWDPTRPGVREAWVATFAGTAAEDRIVRERDRAEAAIISFHAAERAHKS